MPHVEPGDLQIGRGDIAGRPDVLQHLHGGRPALVKVVHPLEIAVRLGESLLGLIEMGLDLRELQHRQQLSPSHFLALLRAYAADNAAGLERQIHLGLGKYPAGQMDRQRFMQHLSPDRLDGDRDSLRAIVVSRTAIP
jgi:hypothetical protein